MKLNLQQLQAQKNSGSVAIPAISLPYRGDTPAGPKGAVTSGRAVLLPDQRKRGVPPYQYDSPSSGGATSLYMLNAQGGLGTW
jgi:hypothetical protein